MECISTCKETLLPDLEEGRDTTWFSWSDQHQRWFFCCGRHEETYFHFEFYFVREKTIFRMKENRLKKLSLRAKKMVTEWLSYTVPWLADSFNDLVVFIFAIIEKRLAAVKALCQSIVFEGLSPCVWRFSWPISLAPLLNYFIWKTIKTIKTRLNLCHVLLSLLCCVFSVPVRKRCKQDGWVSCFLNYNIDWSFDDICSRLWLMIKVLTPATEVNAVFVSAIATTPATWGDDIDVPDHVVIWPKQSIISASMVYLDIGSAIEMLDIHTCRVTYLTPLITW